MQEQKITSLQFPENLENWFSEFIGQVVHMIKTDQIQLETKTASDQTKEMYSGFIQNDPTPMFKIARGESSKFFISNLVKEFLFELKKDQTKLLKLALSYTNSHVLVWAEIDDNDEVTEDKILICEAKINARYHQYGYSLNTTIIEKSDKIPLPRHYQNLELS